MSEGQIYTNVDVLEKKTQENLKRRVKGNFLEYNQSQKMTHQTVHLKTLLSLICP